MSDHRPPACHYDRTLGERVTREHRDDCPNPATHHGCSPCTAPHCVICGKEHLDNDHPLTHPGCVGKVRDDLTSIRTDYALLAVEALEAGADGKLVAAAPIPGGTAQVLIGPTVRLDLVRYSRTMGEDHRHGDPIPPLAVLVQWEDMWRQWFGHAVPTRRATLGRAIGYLRDQVSTMAQQTAGPDWPAFTRQVRTLRANLERALHDEQEPEVGVECFECGDQLVRRFRKAIACRHSTPARVELKRWVQLGYPEALSPLDVRAARRPCGRCDQGGITDPTAGLSWECPGCRKEYDAGEYHTAVRRDLLEGGPDGDGWTHITMAAEAATMMTQVKFTAERIRRWMDRAQVASLCQWSPGSANGLRLVLWSDVRERAAEAVARAHMVELERRREADQEQALRSAVGRGEGVDAAGQRLGIHPARVEKFVALWAVEARREARRSTA